jgi:hypothetical protein
MTPHDASSCRGRMVTREASKELDTLHAACPQTRPRTRRVDTVYSPTDLPGTFLTFAQFVYVAVQTLSTQLVFSPGSSVPRWRRNVVPLRRWAVQVVLFFAVNVSKFKFASRRRGRGRDWNEGLADISEQLRVLLAGEVYVSYLPHSTANLQIPVTVHIIFRSGGKLPAQPRSS